MNEDVLVISRNFACSAERLFAAWCDESASNWMKPMDNVEISYLAGSSFEAGGKAYQCMKMPNGFTMTFLFNFLQIQKPQNIVFVQSVVDEDRNIISAPMQENWPKSIHTEVSIAIDTQSEQHCTMVIKFSPQAASEAEVKTFIDNKNSFGQAWEGAFVRLANYVQSDD